MMRGFVGKEKLFRVVTRSAQGVEKGEKRKKRTHCRFVLDPRRSSLNTVHPLSPVLITTSLTTFECSVLDVNIACSTCPKSTSSGPISTP